MFAVYFGALLLMSGIHTGLVTLGNKEEWSAIIQILVPTFYWGAVAAGLTLFTRRQIRIAYEEPLHKLEEATGKVAAGDFSIYVPPFHTPDKLDYLDMMIMHFNKMVAELGSVETLKTDFFSNVSHEFKTPLAVIQSNAELLSAERMEDGRRRECAGTILQASRRLSSLIVNMLKLNKLDKQAIKPMPKAYDLCGQLCECALQFENQWEQKKIEFEADLEERVMICADQGLLGLALVKRILQLSDGEISVESEPGKGSRFTVRLPRTFEGKEADLNESGAGTEKIYRI